MPWWRTEHRKILPQVDYNDPLLAPRLLLTQSMNNIQSLSMTLSYDTIN